LSTGDVAFGLRATHKRNAGSITSGYLVSTMGAKLASLPRVTKQPTV